MFNEKRIKGLLKAIESGSEKLGLGLVVGKDIKRTG